MIKGGGYRMGNWIWRLCNMAFESGDVPEDWREKERRLNVKNYREISFLSVV